MNISKYFKPKILTWLASAVPLLAGLVVATVPIHGWLAIVTVINNVTGGLPAAVLINAGIAGIGIRGALDK